MFTLFTSDLQNNYSYLTDMLKTMKMRINYVIITSYVPLFTTRCMRKWLETECSTTSQSKVKKGVIITLPNTSNWLTNFQSGVSLATYEVDVLENMRYVSMDKLQFEVSMQHNWSIDAT